MTITESIALAPQPRTTDFSMLPLSEEGINLDALGTPVDDGSPGSPTSKLMRAIAPPNAAQTNPNWQAVSGDFCLSNCNLGSGGGWVAVPHISPGG